MLGVSTFWFAAMGLKHKVMYTGCLLVFTIGVLEANFISNPPSTWYDGYIKCRHNNQTMLNWVMWKDGTTDLKIQYPVWLYGFEVRIHNKISDKFFKLDQLQNTRTAYVRCEAGSFEDYTLFNFEQAHIICQNHTNGTRKLLTVNHTNLDKFKISREIINILFWTQAVEVGTFLNSEDFIVQCLMLNHHGELRKDSCAKSYSSVCVNATVHDTISYIGQDSLVQNYDPTSSSTPVASSAVTSEFVTSQAEEEAEASSIVTGVVSALSSCVVVLIFIIAGMCIKRKQGNNTRIIFQQNELVQPSIVPQEVNDDNSVHVDVISDNIAGREATPYTSLQMTEKHLYTALVGPSFMSTETSFVIGRIANRDFHVETQFEMSERQENNYDEPENDGPGDTNYDDVEVLEKDIPGQTNTESEATTSYSFVK
ncbi:uncharacterized protein LOC127861226 isoform X1 [Dreissena polymorpha]|nr:uncharacterized protein LOC127861226 isoform X1 [Dreissena polymorpha]